MERLSPNTWKVDSKIVLVFINWWVMMLRSRITAKLQRDFFLVYSKVQSPSYLLYYIILLYVHNYSTVLMVFIEQNNQEKRRLVVGGERLIWKIIPRKRKKENLKNKITWKKIQNHVKENNYEISSQQIYTTVWKCWLSSNI